jgi:hypothetical protein
MTRQTLFQLVVRAAPAVAALVLAGAASSPAAAQTCYWVPCQGPPPQSAPETASAGDSGAFEDGYRAGVAAGREQTATTPAASRSRASRSRSATARRHHRPAARTAATRHRPAASSPRRRVQTHRPAPAHPAPPPYTPRTRDLASTYGAANGAVVPLAAFTGRGERWESGYGIRTVWVGPSATSWSGGQLCGWGLRQQMSGAQVHSQAPAWLCQCAEGWRPPVR